MNSHGTGSSATEVTNDKVIIIINIIIIIIRPISVGSEVENVYIVIIINNYYINRHAPYYI